MLFAVYTLVHIKFYDFYNLVPYHTDCLSMSAVSGMTSKCISVLCLNYILLLKEKQSAHPIYFTGFSDFYSNMLSVTFFGDYYSAGLPILIVIIGILTILKF